MRSTAEPVLRVQEASAQYGRASAVSCSRRQLEKTFLRETHTVSCTLPRRHSPCQWAIKSSAVLAPQMP